MHDHDDRKRSVIEIGRKLAVAVTVDMHLGRIGRDAVLWRQPRGEIVGHLRLFALAAGLSWVPDLQRSLQSVAEVEVDRTHAHRPRTGLPRILRHIELRLRLLSAGARSARAAATSHRDPACCAGYAGRTAYARSSAATS